MGKSGDTGKDTGKSGGHHTYFFVVRLGRGAFGFRLSSRIAQAQDAMQTPFQLGHETVIAQRAPRPFVGTQLFNGLRLNSLLCRVRCADHSPLRSAQSLRKNPLTGMIS